MIDALFQAIVSGILVGAIYALVAMGIVIVYRSSGIFNFAHGSVIVVGAFLFWTLLKVAGLPLWLCILISGATASLIGLAIEYLTMRPLLGQPILASIMMTLGLSMFFLGIYQVLWGHKGIVTFPKFMPMGHWVIGEVVIGQANVFVLIAAIALFLLFTLFFKFTGTGKQVQAICESHIIAQSVGIDVKKVLSFVWIIACLCGVLCGILVGATGSVGIYLNELVFMVIPVIILGGLESIGGALVAGLVIGLVETISATFIDPIIGGGFRQVAPYLFLLVVLIVKPYGLFGWERIERI
ncbi:MAG TPA: branched-chain amino acid ABC transporter permease [Desulfobacterales bacterium]|nr:branched-chain amino acid ABC transporter permease [Desulfobacterales bacterium]